MSSSRNYNHLIWPAPATPSISGNQQRGSSSSSNRSLQQQEEPGEWDYYFNPVPFHLTDQHGSHHDHHNNFQRATSQEASHPRLLGAPSGGVRPVPRRVYTIRPVSLTGFPIPERPPSHFFSDHPPAAQQESSKLSKEEQENALKKLKKQVYNSKPKAYLRRVGLYYRDMAKPRDVANNNYNRNAQLDDPDANNCAVCLDEFELGKEVMVTPCNHMFHEDCIVPWVKSNGQCPVCRTVFADKIKKGNDHEPAGSVRNGRMDVRLDHDVLSREVLSIIRAAEQSLAL